MLTRYSMISFSRDLKIIYCGQFQTYPKAWKNSLMNSHISITRIQQLSKFAKLALSFPLVYVFVFAVAQVF